MLSVKSWKSANWKPVALLSLALGVACLGAAKVPVAPSDPRPSEERANRPVTFAHPVNFAHDVAPILYQNCTTCHRPGEVAPFTLSSYADAKKRAKQIAMITQQRVMPPWKADSHGEFQDERRLSDAQIATLTRWADEGAKPGNLAQAPPAPKFPGGWLLGTPDLEIGAPQPYTVEADGRDVYRCYVIPTHFSEDRLGLCHRCPARQPRRGPSCDSLAGHHRHGPRFRGQIA